MRMLKTLWFIGLLLLPFSDGAFASYPTLNNHSSSVCSFKKCPFNIIKISTSVVNPYCTTIHNGSITVSASGGATGGAFSYSLNGGPFQRSNVFSGLAAGTYTITVKDCARCTGTAMVTLVNVNQPMFQSVDIVNASDCSTPNGSITITASGGTPPYVYSDNGGTSFQTSNTFMNLLPDTYDLVIEDARGCRATQPATVESNFSFTVTPVNPTTTSASNGSITFHVTGAVSAYACSIDGGVTFKNSNAGPLPITFDNLPAGTYDLVVMDQIALDTITTNFSVTQIGILPHGPSYPSSTCSSPFIPTGLTPGNHEYFFTNFSIVDTYTVCVYVQPVFAGTHACALTNMLLSVYQPGFDPMHPDLNVIAYQGSPGSLFAFEADPGTLYTIVVTRISGNCNPGKFSLCYATPTTCVLTSEVTLH